MLNEKGVPYDIQYIDLRNKPDWLLEMSPTGKVPVVQTPDGVNLFESAVINEYLDELHAPRLLPAEPLARAQDRMWRDFIAELYGPAFLLYSAKHEDAAREQVQVLQAKLPRFEEVVVGPHFWGERFSVVDVAAAPFLMRLTWVEELAPDFSVLASFPKLAAWRDTLLERPSVQNSVLPEIRTLFAQSVGRYDGWLARYLPEPA